MKTNLLNQKNTKSNSAAFSLIESMIAMATMNIVFLGMYAGIASGLSVMDQSRENARGTQILLEKMETIRLYSWDQVNSNGFVPLSFSAPFQPGETNLSADSVVVYRGSVTITNLPMSESYSNDLKLVTIDLTWTTGGANHTRTMSTLISKYGIQNYVY